MAGASERRVRSIEWAAAAVSAAVVLALLARLLWTALLVEVTPPRLDVAVERAGEGRVAWRITNSGGRSASAVSLAIRVGEEPARRLMIDYVPAGSEVTGAAPAGQGEAVAAWVEGWVDP